jgi:hypothetical protein
MQDLLRVLSIAIVLAIAAFIALGLMNQARGLPAGSMQLVREWQRSLKEELAQLGDALPQTLPGRRKAPQSQGTGSALQQLREAIGCSSPTARAEDPGSEREAYVWSDAQGVRTFSDSPPAGVASSKLTLQSGHPEFFVSVRSDNAVIPARFEGQIAAAAKRAYEQWRDWLGDEAVVRSHINVRFLGDKTQFREIYGKSGNDDWRPVGFYRIRSNEALILYTPGYQPTALSTAFHEMSHLVTAWHLGPTPPWLNEGLAEHFETMQVSQQSARFADNAYHMELLRSEGPVPLADIVSLSGKEWMARDTERRYASAWSLIAFMLDTQAGQRTLKSVINQAYAQRCESGSDLEQALASYPGGITALEKDWLTWLDARYSARSPAYTTRPSSSVRRTGVP